jgi:large subunit ribosomal protein L18
VSLQSSQRRAFRTRNKVKAVSDRPRLSVFRSSQHIYAQVIDDSQGVTIAAASSVTLTDSGTKTDSAKLVGQAIAKAAMDKGVKAVVFDRGSAKYHGRVKALADAAREGGLDF